MTALQTHNVSKADKFGTSTITIAIILFTNPHKTPMSEWAVVAKVERMVVGRIFLCGMALGFGQRRLFVVNKWTSGAGTMPGKRHIGFSFRPRRKPRLRQLVFPPAGGNRAAP